MFWLTIMLLKIVFLWLDELGVCTNIHVGDTKYFMIVSNCLL